MNRTGKMEKRAAAEDKAAHPLEQVTSVRRTARAVALRLSLSVFSLAITLLLLEGVARLIPLWPDQISDFDPELGFAHIPGAKGWWVNIATPLEFRTYVQISSQGLRDQEFEVPKPAGVTRVLLIGDSFVDGLEVPLADTFAKQLERLYRESGKEVEVINGGHYGYGTDQELLFYRLRGREFQPDVVVLCFQAGNDINDNLQAETIAPKPYFELAPDGTLQLKNFPLTPSAPTASSDLTWLEQVKRVLYTHSKLYRSVGYQIKRQSPSLQSFLVRLGVMDEDRAAKPNSLTENAGAETYEAVTSDDYERGWTLTRTLIRELQKEVERSGAELVIAIMPDPQQFDPDVEALGWNVTKWNDRMEQLCDEARLRCLDVYPVFGSLIAAGPNEPLFYPQDGHPTSAGHQRIAERCTIFFRGTPPDLRLWISAGILTPSRGPDNLIQYHFLAEAFDANSFQARRSVRWIKEKL